MTQKQNKDTPETDINKKYTLAKKTMDEAVTDHSFNKAAAMFDETADYKDSKMLADKCRKNANEYRYNIAIAAMDSAASSEDFKMAADQFRKIIPYRDSKLLVEKCTENMKIADMYSEDMSRFHFGGRPDEYTELKSLFEGLSDFRDSADYVQKCELKILEEKERLYNYALRLKSVITIPMQQAALSRFEEIEDYKDSPLKAKECQQCIDDIIARRKKIKRNAIIFLASAAAVVLVCWGVLSGYKSINYRNGVSLIEEGSYEAAEEKFADLGDYKDSPERKAEARFLLLKKEGKLDFAKTRNHLSCSLGYVVGITDSGKVTEAGYNNYEAKYEDCKVSDWKNVIAISAGGYEEVIQKGSIGTYSRPHHTVALKSDGTVYAVGNNYFDQCDVSEWKNITDVAAGANFTVGLKSNGTVMSAGNNQYGQCNVSKWEDITAVSAGFAHTVGLKSNGKVVATGKNTSSECGVYAWEDIVQVSAGYGYTVGLKSDGTVEAVGATSGTKCSVYNWKDIVAVSAGEYHTVGLKSDGTVVAVGDNVDGQCNVSKWRGIVAVSAGSNLTVGLRADGTVVSTAKKTEGGAFGKISLNDINNWKLKVT